MDSDDAGPFLSYIGKRFNDVKSNFKTKISRIGLAFDEDIFSDTLIKCHENISRRSMGENNMIFYFWTAFKNNTLRDLKYSRNKLRGEFPEDIEDEIDFETVTDDFDKISQMIILEFGNELYEYFVLHSNGVSYSKLHQMSDIDNLKYRFRRIREYVRQNYSIDNEK